MNQIVSDEFKPVGSGDNRIYVDTTAIALIVRATRCFIGVRGAARAANAPYAIGMPILASGSHEISGRTTQSRSVASARRIARSFMQWPNT